MATFWQKRGTFCDKCDEGEYIKRLVFPDHMTALALTEILLHCKNVTQLSLPSVMIKLGSEQLEIALQMMSYLENLEIQLSSKIKPLLQIGRLRELTVHVKVTFKGITSLIENSYKLLTLVVYIRTNLRYMPLFGSRRIMGHLCKTSRNSTCIKYYLQNIDL